MSQAARDAQVSAIFISLVLYGWSLVAPMATWQNASNGSIWQNDELAKYASQI